MTGIEGVTGVTAVTGLAYGSPTAAGPTPLFSYYFSIEDVTGCNTCNTHCSVRVFCVTARDRCDGFGHLKIKKQRWLEKTGSYGVPGRSIGRWRWRNSGGAELTSPLTFLLSPPLGHLSPAEPMVAS